MTKLAEECLSLRSATDSEARWVGVGLVQHSSSLLSVTPLLLDGCVEISIRCLFVQRR